MQTIGLESKMKLDKIAFAKLIGFISYRYSLTIIEDDMREIDYLINIDVSEQHTVVSERDVNDLLMHIKNAHQKPDGSFNSGFIPAIKAYRAITGVGLKEAKEAIEKYR